jgi:hypothetical protein
VSAAPGSAISVSVPSSGRSRIRENAIMLRACDEAEEVTSVRSAPARVSTGSAGSGSATPGATARRRAASVASQMT